MIKILFICHGNICRSPMAEFVFRDIVEKNNLKDKFEISSAATSTEEIWNGVGNPIYRPAQAELKKHGIGKTEYTNFSSKRARQVTTEDYNYYDYMLCADSANIKNTTRIVGGNPCNKIHLLLEYADEKYLSKKKDLTIADPWYTGDFTATYEDVIAGCEGFLEYCKKTVI